MADENNASSTAETATTAVPAAPEPKKQRAARRPKAAVEMMGGMAVAKAPRGRRKRSEQAVDTAETRVAAKRSAKSPVKEDGPKRRSRQVAQPAPAAVSAVDEMADLIQLEEENQKLRKALSEKLRAENASLRKRLGLG